MLMFLAISYLPGDSSSPGPPRVFLSHARKKYPKKVRLGELCSPKNLSDNGADFAALRTGDLFAVRGIP